MATLTPTLTLASSDMNGDTLNLSVTDTLAVLGQVTTKQVVASATNTVFATAANYTKSYVYIKNHSTVAAEIITIGNPSIDATCDYNNDPTIAMDATNILRFGMTVSGTGIPAAATVASITSATAFELSASTTGGNLANQTLTFGTDEYFKLGAGEFAFFPWMASEATAASQDVSLALKTASGSPVLEVRIYQEAAS